MTNLFFDIPLRTEENVFHSVVEIPKNSRIKYEYNEKLGVIEVDRIFRTPVAYPQNYGFFPRTWNRFDKDPMDVIIISSETFVPGTLVQVRVVGMIEMDDSGELDHKILAIPVGHSDYAHIKDIKDLDTEIIENLTWFLAHYKDREKGKEVKILGVKNAKVALEFLVDCETEFAKKHS